MHMTKYTIQKLLFVLLLFCLALGQKVHAQEATTWQDDYRYELDEENKLITIQEYIGEDKVLTVPGTAVIEEKEYSTKPGEHPWKDAELTGLSFGRGVQLADDIRGLFEGCDKLNTLDLRYFDISELICTNFLDPCPALSRLRTPKKTGQEKIKLPDTFYDDSAKAYTYLPREAYRSIWLEKGPIDASDAEVEASPQVYTGHALTPPVTVTFKGRKISASNYRITYLNNVNIGTAVIAVKFTGIYTGTATGSFVISESYEKIPKTQTILKNTTTYYRVTKKGKEVRFMRPVNKDKVVITVPATVRLRGHRYKVTSIAKNAFRGNQKVKKIIIGKNVRKIGSYAFYNTKKLKKIVIRLQGIKAAKKFRMPKSAVRRKKTKKITVILSGKKKAKKIFKRRFRKYKTIRVK